jgi:polyhydroxyalkanoate synthesis regulator phasin
MERMTIKAYAIKHKLSIYNVMKMVRTGKLNTELVEENGKEVTYILVEEAQEAVIQEQILPLNAKEDRTVEEEIALLKAEVALLKKEVAKLKESI